MKVKAILNFLKLELETNFKVKKSLIIQLEPDVLGNTADYFVFESLELAIDVMYWETGIINLGGLNIITDDIFMNFWYVPDDYHQKVYPKESEEMFVIKVNELLRFLHNENPNIKSCLPNDI